jgi:predicted RNA-binding protein with PIN domain
MKKKSTRRAGKRFSASRPALERTIIIDGYNLILRSPAFRPDDRRDLAMAREKLVNLLSWTVGRGQAEFIVVFDGSETAFGSRRTERSGTVTVRFSDPPQSADDLIRQIVEEYTEDEVKVTVVTADVEVASHARACGASVVISDIFAASLFPDRVKREVERHQRGRQAEASEGSEKPLGFSKKELEEWARIFSEPGDEEEESF